MSHINDFLTGEISLTGSFLQELLTLFRQLWNIILTGGHGLQAIDDIADLSPEFIVVDVIAAQHKVEIQHICQCIKDMLGCDELIPVLDTDIDSVLHEGRKLRRFIHC